MVVCDQWIALKIFEVIFCIACLAYKRVTDDESVRLSLYLQKISREWPLLRNITWDSIGASFGDAIYGGYILITFGLLLGRMYHEIPNGRRIIEGFLLGMGVVFFIVLGGLELASLESVPDSLIDNAAILGTLSLITATLFIIDLAGPRNTTLNKNHRQDAERNVFVYPNLPKVEKIRENNSVPVNANGHIETKRPSSFPEKLTEHNPSKMAPTSTEQPQFKTSEENNVQNTTGKSFTIEESDEFTKYSKDETDGGIFQKIEKSKYGSVRNGDALHSDQNNVKPNKSASTKTKSIALDKNDSLDDVIRSLREHEREMERNVSYLKMLDEKGRTSKNGFEEDLDKLNEEYMREYHKERVFKLNEANKVLPTTFTRTEYEKWEKFEEDNVPKFPVKEDYLPELQTPIFARIKEKNSVKGYGVYDNVTLFNINTKTDSASQTDTLKSKASTLRASKPPTLQQIAEYFGLPHKPPLKKEASVQIDNNDSPAVSFYLPQGKSKTDDGSNINYNGGPSSPTDPGYVQYTAQQWNDRMARQHSTRTPRHSPSET